jgi:hypothetical protein
VNPQTTAACPSRARRPYCRSVSCLWFMGIAQNMPTSTTPLTYLAFGPVGISRRPLFPHVPMLSRMLAELLVSRHIRQDLRRLTTSFGNVEIFPAWAGPRANALEHRRSRAFGRHIMRTISRSGPAPKARSKPRILKITGLGIAQELITLACSRSWMRDSGATKRAGISLEQPRRRIDQQPVPFFWRSDYSLENGFPGQR